MVFGGRSRLGAHTSVAAIALLIFALAGAAHGVTYIQMLDRDLYEQADVIAEVSIVRQLPALVGDPPQTQYYAAIENVIKGSPGASSIVLSSPGGRARDGGELVVPGAPRFEEGDRVLVFLARDRTRGYSLLHLGLGTFHKVGSDRRALAVRRLAGVTLVDRDLKPAIELVREYDAFVRWLERRRRGIIEEAAYFVPRIRGFAAPYRLVKVGGMNVRWFEFDDGKTINWSIRNTASSSTQPQFGQALAVWSRAPVSLRLASGTNSTAGFLVLELDRTLRGPGLPAHSRSRHCDQRWCRLPAQQQPPWNRGALYS